jgi:glutathione peroxidase-family protein
VIAGFEILAFPCNQFLKQEPGSSEDAQQFACTRYKAEYPIFQKVVGYVYISVSHMCRHTDTHKHTLAAFCVDCKLKYN